MCAVLWLSRSSVALCMCNLSSNVRQVVDSMGRRERKAVTTYNETSSFHELLKGSGLTRGTGKGGKAMLPKALR